MSFEINAKMLFSDTDIPDVFIKEYLPVLDGDSVRVYIYCVFIAKKGLVDPSRLNDILGISETQLSECFTKLETFGLISQKTKKIVISDLKEKELNKYFRPKSALDTQDNAIRKHTSVRVNAVKHISDTFFAGQMSNSWYNDVDLWYDKYEFEDAVMFMLFNHCANHLTKSGSSLSRGKEYVKKVAEDWSNKGIRTPEQLDAYLIEYDRFKVFRNTVAKKANIKNIDEYQEAVLLKWFFEYKYTFEIIEIALKNASSYYKNPSVGIYDRMITEWFTKGLNTHNDILNYEEEKKKKYIENKKNTPYKANPEGVWNFENQRDFDKDYSKYFDEIDNRKDT